MNKGATIRSGVRWLDAGVGLAVAACASSVGIIWCLYGRPKRQAGAKSGEPQLDEFISECDVVERHGTRVASPVGIAFELAFLAAAATGNSAPSGILLGGFGFILLILSGLVLVFTIRQLTPA